MRCAKRRSVLGLGGQTVVLVRETLQHKGYSWAECVNFRGRQEEENGQVGRTEARAEHDTFTDLDVQPATAWAPDVTVSVESDSTRSAILLRLLSPT